MSVSGNRPPTRDHQRKILTAPRRAGKSSMALIKYEGQSAATCNCGWAGYHTRAKVLEDKIDRHLAKAHHGRGIRL